MMQRRRSHRSKEGYRSRFEEKVAHTLEKMGVAFSYETKKLTYTVFRTYKPDFILPNGVIVEAKGYFTPSDRTKHLRVREAHPELDIRFCFQNSKVKLNKTSNTTYAEWCDKKGFKWCDKVIPVTWVS